MARLVARLRRSVLSDEPVVPPALRLPGFRLHDLHGEAAVAVENRVLDPAELTWPPNPEALLPEHVLDHAAWKVFSQQVHDLLDGRRFGVLAQTDIEVAQVLLPARLVVLMLSVTTLSSCRSLFGRKELLGPLIDAALQAVFVTLGDAL